MRALLLALLALAVAAHPFDLMINQITHQRHIAHRNALHANYSHYRSLNATPDVALEAPESLVSATLSALARSLDPVMDLIRSVADSWHSQQQARRADRKGSPVLVY